MLVGDEPEYVSPELASGRPGGSGSGGDRAERMLRMKMDLEKHGVALNETVGGILRDTVEGMEEIKRQISDQYGEISIIGRGESRNGLLLSTSRPDFIALAGDQKKLVLVEVKNTKKVNSTTDRFQAEFYNMVGTRFGITVMEVYGKPNLMRIAPMTTRQRTSETVLIYPRHGKFEVIKDKVNANRKTVQGIWMAKQLGMKGKSPKTDCDNSCPHHRFDRLPEGNIEVAIPLPLAYSKGKIEHGVDLNAAYWKRFLRRKGIASITAQFRWESVLERVGIDKITDPAERKARLGNLEKSKRDFVDTIAERTGLEKKWIQGGAYRNIGGAETDKDVERDMANEIEAWKKILGPRRLKRSKAYAKGQGTRIYSLPRNSTGFVKRSWDEWL